MPLGDRIKALRSEAGLSQAELAETIGGDGRQISRYENGRITPSLDNLVFDDIDRRPLHTPEHALTARLTRTRLRTITNGS